MEPKKPMGATEFPATLTVAPETAAPAESFTEPEIRPPAVAALGRIVTGFGDRITPTASAKRAETAISEPNQNLRALCRWKRVIGLVK